MIAALAALFSLLAVPVALGAYDMSEAQMMNGLRPGDLEKAALDDPRVVLPNNTWVPFAFTNAGSWGRPLFELGNPLGTVVRAIEFTDAFCAGDQFTMYWTSAGLLNFNVPGSVPEGAPSCTNYTLDPGTASFSTAFSWGNVGAFNYAPVVNITMVVTVSPYSAGRGYVRARYI